MDKEMEALITANEYLDNLKGGINSYIEYQKNSDMENASNLMPLILDGIQWILKVIELTENSQKETIDLDDFIDKMNELLDGVENEDYSLISEIFEYEVLPALDEIHVKIRKSVLN